MRHPFGTVQLNTTYDEGHEAAIYDDTNDVEEALSVVETCCLYVLVLADLETKNNHLQGSSQWLAYEI